MEGLRKKSCAILPVPSASEQVTPQHGSGSEQAATALVDCVGHSIQGSTVLSDMTPLNHAQDKAFMQIQSKLAIGLSALMIAIISLLTLTPVTAPSLDSIEHADKIYHALAFAGLALPIATLRPNWLFVAVPVYAAFGGLIEIIQPFVGRDCSLADWVADLTGIGLGSLAGRILVACARPFRSLKACGQ